MIDKMVLLLEGLIVGIVMIYAVILSALNLYPTLKNGTDTAISAYPQAAPVGIITTLFWIILAIVLLIAFLRMMFGYLKTHKGR